MRHLSRWLLPVAAFAAIIIGASGQNGERATSASNHVVMATRLYTGLDGQSHIDQTPIVLRTTPPIDANGAPAEQSEVQKTSDAYLVRAAPGMFESWHNASQKRFVVVISGEAEIGTSSGEKARIVPGQIYLADDLTGKGHTFRVVGDKEWVALFVNFAQ
jgi:hypothetical protein